MQTEIFKRACRIAKAMGPTWKAVDYGFGNHIAQIEDTNDERSGKRGFHVSIRSEQWTKSNRLEIAGNFELPKPAGYSKPDGLPCGKASVAADKTDEQIAKDILRRVVPNYRAAFDQVWARFQASLAYQNRQNETRDALFSAIGYKPTERELSQESSSFHVYRHGLRNVDVYADSVNVELRIPANRIADFAALVATFPNQ